MPFQFTYHNFKTQTKKAFDEKKLIIQHPELYEGADNFICQNVYDNGCYCIVGASLPDYIRDNEVYTGVVQLTDDEHIEFPNRNLRNAVTRLQHLHDTSIRNGIRPRIDRLLALFGNLPETEADFAKEVEAL